MTLPAAVKLAIAAAAGRARVTVLALCLIAVTMLNASSAGVSEGSNPETLWIDAILKLGISGAVIVMTYFLLREVIRRPVHESTPSELKAMSSEVHKLALAVVGLQTQAEERSKAMESEMARIRDRIHDLANFMSAMSGSRGGGAYQTKRDE